MPMPRRYIYQWAFNMTWGGTLHVILRSSNASTQPRCSYRQKIPADACARPRAMDVSRCLCPHCVRGRAFETARPTVCVRTAP